jgi:hypothetical protein
MPAMKELQVYIVAQMSRACPLLRYRWLRGNAVQACSKMHVRSWIPWLSNADKNSNCYVFALADRLYINATRASYR